MERNNNFLIHDISELGYEFKFLVVGYISGERNSYHLCRNRYEVKRITKAGKTNETNK